MSSGTKTLEAATKATAAAADAIPPARAALQAAREALAAAEAEHIEAIIVKNPDPQAARDRIEKSRAAIKLADDDVNWRILELHAFEAQHEEANQHEQGARQRVWVERYQAEDRAYNDPDNRENHLLATLADTVTELTLLLSDRKDLHDQLSTACQQMPVDERPKPTGTKRITTNSTRGVMESFAQIPPEVAAVVKEALATANAELAERRRAARHG